MTPTQREKWVGYGLVVFTLSVWASFILISRLAGKSVLTPWDTTALRFGTAAVVLLPYVLLKMDISFFIGDLSWWRCSEVWVMPCSLMLALA